MENSAEIYQDIDFSRLYLNHMARAGRVEKPACSWDERAEKMATVCANPEDDYLKSFLSLMDLSGAETLLDVGCGPGTICLPVRHTCVRYTASTIAQVCLTRLNAEPRRQK